MAIVTTSGTDDLRVRVDAETGELKRVRSAVRDWLNLNNRPVGDWDLVVTELVRNAMTASPTGSIDLRMYLDVGAEDGVDCAGIRICCDVTNEGEWDPEGISLPAPLSYLVVKLGSPSDNRPHGRGLRLVSALTSGGWVQAKDELTIMRVWLDTCGATPL